MRLFTGVVCLSLSIVSYYITLLGCRNPRRPRWANDFLVANVYTTGVIAVGVYGLADLVRFASDLRSGPFPLQQAWMAGAALAAAFVAVKALRVEKTLARYAADAPAPAASRPGAGNPDDGRPKPPVQPSGRKLAA